MWNKWILPFFGILLLRSSAVGQSTYHSLAQDTIITKQGFLTNTYLLDGKRLSLEVMEFFMAGNPSAYNQIKVANLTDQLSLAGYSIGSILLLTGILINEDNPRLSRDLYFYGGIGLGSGIIFQIISHTYQKEAVYLYNEGIKSAYHRKSSVGVYWGVGAEGAGMRIRF
jgi:hypothetical protein